MQSCAFLTLADPTGYHIDDHLAADALRAVGYAVETIPWDAPGQVWDRFDAVVVRSTWDYHTQVDAFFDVLDHIASSGPRLFNPLGVMRWNADKRYLADLAEKGVAVVPTLFGRAFERGDAAHFADIMETRDLVIKPIRGANAEGAFRLGPDDVPEAAVARFASDDFMVQPFVPTVTSQGEVSLFYFGGRYSHAIQKIPSKGDFRVQEEHGGTIRSWTPGESAHEAGTRVMQGLAERWPDAPTLYARVDLVWGDDAWWLMELEVIEPSLYFRMDTHAAHRFAEALHSAIR